MQQKSLNSLSKFLTSAVLFALVSLLSGCGYDALQTTDQQVKSSWAEVLNQYRHRAELIPDLIGTVKSYAAQEEETLQGLTRVHAKAGNIQATPELVNDSDAFINFQNVQSELNSALTRLLEVAENYPELTSSTHFQDLQTQLQEAEDHIAVARNHYIQAVQDYNVIVRSFPSSLAAMVFGYQLKLSFITENENKTSSEKADF